MIAVRLAFKLLRQDLASGELRLLGLALVLAVAAATAVSFFTDRVRQGLHEQGASLIAADLAIEHADPLPHDLMAGARQRGLQTSAWLTFPSVVFNGERPVLVQVKGVDADYPLRGALLIRSQPGQNAQPITGPPPSGSIWVAPRLLTLLNAKVGDSVPLGELTVRIAGVIAKEPDSGGNLFQFAPRVMIDSSALADSGLLGPASRVKHRLLVAGPRAGVARYRNWVQKQLPPGAQLFDLNNARPELRLALERATAFLNLAALTASLLAAAALAISSRGYIRRQSAAAALMRSLGARAGLVLGIFTVRLLVIALIASALGSLAGLLGQQLLVELVGGWFAVDLPTPGVDGALVGLLLGLGLMAGFALPPLIRLSRVPPLQVLRGGGLSETGHLVDWLLAGLALVGLAFWQADDAALAGRLLGGLLASLLLFYGAAGLLLRLATTALPTLGGSWRAGAAALQRHAAMTRLQLAAFGLAITVLLVLTTVRGDLLNTWQASLPPQTPDHFLINIQPGEVAPLTALLRKHGIADAALHPMIRGRLVAINDQSVEPQAFDSPRARRLATREFNLSRATTLQADNRIVAGRWWGDSGSQSAGWSVEAELADTLGISLGDTLSFDVAGNRVSAPVTSLRSVRWDSFNANFFVIGSPAVLDRQPATYITSFYLADQQPLLRALSERFPGVSVLDAGALLDQVRQVIARGAHAVQAVFGFTLLTALVLLLAVMQTQAAQRARETGVLRSLGASNKQLLGASAVEFGGLGLLAGLLGATMASVMGWLLASQVFELAWLPDAQLWLTGLAVGVLSIGLTGLAVSRKLLDAPPARLLNQRLD